jgi:hypothetical protein
MLIIIAVLWLIHVIEIYSGPCSRSDEGGTQSDISIESENTVYINVFKEIRSNLYTSVQSN